jgi:hypothetical protein
MADPFSPENLLTFPLDPADERHDLRRDQDRLAIIARCKAIICAPEARGVLPAACWLALDTSLPVPECLRMLNYLGGVGPDMERRARELARALEVGATEAAAVLGFHDEPDERAAA